MPSLSPEYENILWNEGRIPAGVDEAGRGPLAGPVVAASVILSREEPVYGLNDSKALTSAKRSGLYEEIYKKAVSVAVGIVENEIIDEI